MEHRLVVSIASAVIAAAVLTSARPARASWSRWDNNSGECIATKNPNGVSDFLQYLAWPDGTNGPGPWVLGCNKDGNNNYYIYKWVSSSSSFVYTNGDALAIGDNRDTLTVDPWVLSASGSFFAYAVISNDWTPELVGNQSTTLSQDANGKGGQGQSILRDSVGNIYWIGNATGCGQTGAGHCVYKYSVSSQRVCQYTSGEKVGTAASFLAMDLSSTADTLYMIDFDNQLIYQDTGSGCSGNFVLFQNALDSHLANNICVSNGTIWAIAASNDPGKDYYYLMSLSSGTNYHFQMTDTTKHLGSIACDPNRNSDLIASSRDDGFLYEWAN